MTIADNPDMPARDSLLVRQLADLCHSEAVDALCASPWLGRLPRRLLGRLLDRPVGLFAGRLARLDAGIDRLGLVQASRWGLSQWTTGLQVEGRAHLPGHGPLLIVCNHPGMVDALAVLAQLSGHDTRLLVAERPLLGAMPALCKHLITTPDSGTRRSHAMRLAARHLRAGHTLLTFPAGQIEPDPAVRLPDALASLSSWSASTACLARWVPGLTILPMAVTGVLAPRQRNHLWARQCPDEAARDWLAATRQILRRRPRDTQPTLRIGLPVATSGGGSDDVNINTALSPAMTTLMLGTNDAQVQAPDGLRYREQPALR